MLFPALHVFGYTAWPTKTSIGAMLHTMRIDCWERFAVRTSGGLHNEPRTAVKRQADRRLGEIICPAQTGRTAACSTCGLCWQSKRPIIFKPHGDQA